MNKKTDASELKTLLEQAKERSFEYIDDLENLPPFPTDDALSGLSMFDEDMPDEPCDPGEVIDMLAQYGAPATCASNGGNYYGYVNGGILPVSMAAEWIIDTWNQNCGFYNMSPACGAIEEVAEKWIVDLFGFPEGSAMGLVTGSATGLLTCFIAARNELLRRQGWDVKRKGVVGSPGFRVVLSEDAHSTVKSALFSLGVGVDEMEFVKVDDCGRMIPGEVPELDERTLFILQAGHICGGSYDPIDELCDLGNKAGSWIHVDGAFGMWAAVTPAQAHYVKGLGKADSSNMDVHKTLNAGYDNSILLCKDRSVLAQAMSLNASYLAPGQGRDNNSYTPEMSRRARGVVLWATLKQLGRKGLADLMDHLCDLTQYFATGLAGAGFEIVNEPFFNQFFMRASNEDHTVRCLSALQKSGMAWSGPAVWKGENVMRISVSSHNTSFDDIDRSIAAYKEAFEETK